MEHVTLSLSMRWKNQSSSPRMDIIYLLILDLSLIHIFQYNANGYVNLLKLDNTNLDIVLMFFKTLAQLSDLDIRVLKSYSYFGNDGESLLDICKDIHIDFEQMRFIREKLERFGLLQSKNEEINDNNLEAVVKYLQNLEKESKKSKPGTVKIPKLKKVSGSDSYKITPLGRQYLT